MSNQKYYYKVVTEDLKSVIVYKDENYCIQYKIGEFVSTKHIGKGLLVFKKLESAKWFIKINSSFLKERLFKCEVKNRVPLHDCFTAINRKIIEAFILINDWPENTESFEQVKLIKEIKV